MSLEDSQNKQSETRRKSLTSDVSWIANTEWEKIGRKHISPQRKGDIAEHHCIVWLWSKGYEVFRNSGQSGAVDLIALNVNSGELLLVDVKSYKDGRLSSRTPTQKKLGVRYLHYNPHTKKIRFVKHKSIHKGAK